jgi:hypothetical protein
MLDSSRRLRVDEIKTSFPRHDSCGSGTVLIAAGVQPSAELDDKFAAPVRDPIERPPAVLHRESSTIVYCGTAQDVSEGFAIALRAMGVEANFLPWDIASDTKNPNTEDN